MKNGRLISSSALKNSIFQELNENLRKQQNVWNAYSFDEERCFIKFYGVENFIKEIDNYDDHQIKRKRKTDRSLETLGNY